MVQFIKLRNVWKISFSKYYQVRFHFRSIVYDYYLSHGGSTWIICKNVPQRWEWYYVMRHLSILSIFTVLCDDPDEVLVVRKPVMYVHLAISGKPFASLIFDHLGNSINAEFDNQETMKMFEDHAFNWPTSKTLCKTHYVCLRFTVVCNIKIHRCERVLLISKEYSVYRYEHFKNAGKKKFSLREIVPVANQGYRILGSTFTGRSIQSFITSHELTWVNKSSFSVISSSVKGSASSIFFCSSRCKRVASLPSSGFLGT
jgi:hypothetical protein